MDIITYTLTENRPDSDTYYNKISDFADRVLNKAVEAVKAPVSGIAFNVTKVMVGNT